MVLKLFIYILKTKLNLKKFKVLLVHEYVPMLFWNKYSNSLGSKYTKLCKRYFNLVNKTYANMEIIL